MGFFSSAFVIQGRFISALHLYNHFKILKSNIKTPFLKFIIQAMQF